MAFQKWDFEIFLKILKYIVLWILIWEQNIFGLIWRTIWEESITLNRTLGTLKKEIFENYLKFWSAVDFLFWYYNKMYPALFVELFELNPEL